jgi:hypothetical protein
VGDKAVTVTTAAKISRRHISATNNITDSVCLQATEKNTFNHALENIIFGAV